MDNCIRLLGRDILGCLSFATSHIEFDVGHTKFNAHFLGQMIAESPCRLSYLVRAGTAALDAFSVHLADCLTLAESFLEE